MRIIKVVPEARFASWAMKSVPNPGFQENNGLAESQCFREIMGEIRKPIDPRSRQFAWHCCGRRASFVPVVPGCQMMVGGVVPARLKG